MDGLKKLEKRREKDSKPGVILTLDVNSIRNTKKAIGPTELNRRVYAMQRRAL